LPKAFKIKPKNKRTDTFIFIVYIVLVA
jgi:hypothetical protein